MSYYENDDVNEAAILFRVEAKRIIGDLAAQKEEAYNIGIAPQTLNKMLNESQLPAFALARMRCGRILISYLEKEWRENFEGGELKSDNNLSDIIREIVEHSGIISHLARNANPANKSEALKHLQEMKEAIVRFETELYRVFEV